VRYNDGGRTGERSVAAASIASNCLCEGSRKLKNEARLRDTFNHWQNSLDLEDSQKLVLAPLQLLAVMGSRQEYNGKTRVAGRQTSGMRLQNVGFDMCCPTTDRIECHRFRRPRLPPAFNNRR